MSSQPPKAGIRFPGELAARLANATTASLTTDALADRWIAVLEAAAFSPVRALVQPTSKPTQVSDELLATVKRVGPLLPQVAALFEIAVTEGGPAPKPLRPTRPTPQKKAAKPTTPRPPKQERHPEPAPAAQEQEPEQAQEPEQTQAHEPVPQPEQEPEHEPDAPADASAEVEAEATTPVEEPSVEPAPADEPVQETPEP
jgi:hypothetical protein